MHAFALPIHDETVRHKVANTATMATPSMLPCKPVYECCLDALDVLVLVRNVRLAVVCTLSIVLQRKDKGSQAHTCEPTKHKRKKCDSGHRSGRF